MAEEIKDTQVDETEAQTTTETSAETTETSAEETKSFTQAELDDIVAKRLERERKKYGDYDDMKAKLGDLEKEAEERRLAEMSEKERAEELAQKYQAEKDAMSQQLTAYQEQVKQERINNAFITQATTANIAYIDDAIKLADLSAVEVGEDGVVKGVESVIAQLTESKPYLLAQKETPQPKQVGGGASNGGQGTDKSGEQLLAEAAQKAKETGRTEDRAAYSRLKRQLSN
ncbi:phage capsid and scaffold [Geomicrobium sp. JCM 19037]|uniref:phage scaffolding protein n=1 Tax=Geomicrobium sp. JCM 19037 TaxID=1460634 RepID=UPI00045F18F9|nr:phage scaffolding protein [Geomicrobium sp. JCM 19037]GAK03261.1 phage capsid and scaffold [Geomicrobium sp. JCM 19037]